MIEDYKNKVSYLEILVYRLNNLISYLLENSDEATNLYEDYKAKKNDKDIKKELERLRESEKDKEIERLNNIINKVREYIKEHIRIDDEYPNYMEMLLEEYKELLEILDKE